MDFRQLRDGDEADLWITHKLARIAMYQQVVDDIDKVLEREGIDAGMHGLIRQKMHAAKAAAEELGQLPQRTQPAPEKHEVTFKYEMAEANDV